MSQTTSFHKELIMICFCAAIMYFPLTVNAQPGFDDTVQDTPIDGGVSILIAAGAGYGFKNYGKRRSLQITKIQLNNF